MRLSSSSLGVFCILVSTGCFAFQGIFIKKLIAIDISISAMLFWRQMLFWPIYFLYIGFFQREIIRWIGWPDATKVMLVGVLGFFLIPLTNSTALYHIEAGIERVLLYSYPIFVVLIEALYRRRWPEPRFILAFFAIQAGIFLLVGGGDAMAHLLANLGPSLQVLFAAVQFALYTLLLRPWAQKLGSNGFFLYGITGSFVVITINYFLQEPFTIPTTEAFWLLFLMMLVSFPPSILFAEGVRRIGGARASFISTLGPVITIIAAERLLGEHLSLAQLLGGGMVLLTLALLEAKTLSQLFRLPKKRNLP